MEYVIGSKEDNEDIIDFIDLIFSKNSGPHDFKTLLPKLYTNNTSMYHYLAKEDGKIRGVICVYPFTIKMGDDYLECNGVGSVSVHPSQRGKGIMKKLMDFALCNMDCHVSFLFGNRHRYQYYGYEKGGTQFNFTFTKDSLKHGNLKEKYDLKFIEGFNNEILNLYRNEKMYIQRNNSFEKTCKTWGNKLYGIYCEENFIGYIVFNNNKIVELILNNMKYMPSVLIEHMNLQDIDESNLILSSLDKNKIKYFLDLKENYTIEENANINILNFPYFLKFNIKANLIYKKIKYSNVIEFDGVKYKINIDDYDVTVEETTENAIITLPRNQGVEILFSPLGKYLLEDELFPLDVYVSPLDLI
ncbi:MAG: GNAT family N-acetyltransferase [Lachnospirales bacterium]